MTNSQAQKLEIMIMQLKERAGKLLEINILRFNERSQNRELADSGVRKCEKSVVLWICETQQENEYERAIEAIKKANMYITEIIDEVVFNSGHPNFFVSLKNKLDYEEIIRSSKPNLTVTGNDDDEIPF